MVATSWMLGNTWEFLGIPPRLHPLNMFCPKIDDVLDVYLFKNGGFHIASPCNHAKLAARIILSYEIHLNPHQITKNN